MADLNININGRDFGISCDDGQEQRVIDIGHYVDSKLKEISKAGAANSESHLLVLTALVLADEIFELRESKDANITSGADTATTTTPESVANGAPIDDEEAIAQAIENLASRIEGIAERVQKV